MEFLDVLNPDGSPAGERLSREEVHRKGLHHRTVHVWVRNAKGELLLQKRSSTKEVPRDYGIFHAPDISAPATAALTVRYVSSRKNWGYL